MTRSPITISDVARLAGVSPSLASQALNNRGRVAADTRERILKAAHDLGYVANLAARGLKGGRTNLLGMIVPELGAQYFTEILKGASDASREAGMNLLLSTTADDPSEEHRSVAMLAGGLTDGLIIILPRNVEYDVRTLERTRVPVVLINHRGTDSKLPSVRADNRRGAAAAVDHLIALGHRRVGFISGRADSGQSDERLLGYRDALAEAGLAYDPTLVKSGHFTQPGGFQAASTLLDEGVSAIFAANDLSAFGAYDAVKDRGLRVPEDVSVVGFDDIPMASQVHPPLTTVRHPLPEIGRAGAQLLLTLIQGAEPSERQIELSSELVLRASTSPPRQ